MKMSDVWPCGFEGVDFSYGFYLKAETLSGEKFNATENAPLCGLIFSHEEPAKATMHAINNHDRLTEENANLREALLGLLGCKGILTSDKECVINAKNLLKEQNNDK